MGANIATWIDTLFAALLLDSPRAFTIVLTEMIAGASVSLIVLFFLYEPYTPLILGLAHRVSSSRRNLAIVPRLLLRHAAAPPRPVTWVLNLEILSGTSDCSRP